MLGVEIILAAIALDLLMGDPRNFPHPVIFIGKGITFGERIVRKLTSTPQGLKIGGTILSLSIIFGTYFLFAAILGIAFKLHNYLGIALSVLFMSQTLAVNSLYKHAIAVARPLSTGDLVTARKELSMIVGRDTNHSDEDDLVRGVVETVSENTVDGITAPLFYGFIGGVPLAMAYKAVNTLDSMIGYKDERYLHLGWAGAKLDDLVNYVPARVTGVIYLLISFFTPGGFKGVWVTMKEDAHRHLSPNSGIPESAVAGALKIQLGGLNYYRGVESRRAFMGKPINTREMKHIYQSLYIMFSVSAVMVAIGIIYSILIR